MAMRSLRGRTTTWRPLMTVRSWSHPHGHLGRAFAADHTNSVTTSCQDRRWNLPTLTSSCCRTARWLRFGTGGGITCGSDPGQEWAETELKAARLIGLACGRLEPGANKARANKPTATRAPAR